MVLPWNSHGMDIKDPAQQEVQREFSDAQTCLKTHLGDLTLIPRPLKPLDFQLLYNSVSVVMQK